MRALIGCKVVTWPLGASLVDETERHWQAPGLGAPPALYCQSLGRSALYVFSCREPLT